MKCRICNKKKTIGVFEQIKKFSLFKTKCFNSSKFNGGTEKKAFQID